VASQLIGERNRNGLYRAFYICQSVATFAALSQYIRRQPDRVLYEVPQPWAGALRVAQAGCLGVATWAAREVGVVRITGLAAFKAWCRGQAVPPEPEAQGPAPDDNGALSASGPFAWSRHPLNFWPLPIFWLNPRMTANLLAFSTAATLYLIVGSAHEEARLKAAYGDQYIIYQRSRVPFYLPRRILRLLRREEKILLKSNA
jgi:methanethiol S-methyltransferase